MRDKLAVQKRLLRIFHRRILASSGTLAGAPKRRRAGKREIMDYLEFLERHRALYPDGCIPEKHIDIIAAIADELHLQGRNPISLSSSSCFELIRRFEKYGRELPDGRVEAVQSGSADGGGWTIAWGCSGPEIKAGTVWTRDEAEREFREHVQQIARGVMGLLAGAPTSQNQFDALTSFAHQNGLTTLASSTLLQKHRAGDYTAAANDFSKWNKIGARVRRWLVRRRTTEADLYQGKVG